MPKMIEGTEGLKELVGALVTPRNYYEGRRRRRRGMPDNIVMFHRRGREAQRHPGDPRHFHYRHVMVIPLAGQGRMVVNGSAYTLEPGRCALIAPYQFHHFTAFSDGLVSWLVVTFEWLEYRTSRTVFQMPPGGAFWRELGWMVEEYTGAGDGDRLAHLLALALLELSRARAAQAGGGAGGELTLKIHKMIASNLRRKPRAAELADRLGLSASHLRAKFRAEAGRSLGNFQKEIRLQKAAELLAQSSRTVAETAETCGWESPFAFSRAFSAYWGKSPKRFSLFSKAG
ncbi:MAG: AraC family transcriptional regulator [Opitutaceae bacterium]|nr:AraC family transcriptional regulator [Opitutaceae bacterium]